MICPLHDALKIASGQGFSDYCLLTRVNNGSQTVTHA